MSEDRHCFFFFLIPQFPLFFLLLFKKCILFEEVLFKGEDPDSREGVFKMFFVVVVCNILIMS